MEAERWERGHRESGSTRGCPRPGFIPWLLVKVVSHAGNGLLTNVTTIQRVRTHGGQPPARVVMRLIVMPKPKAVTLRTITSMPRRSERTQGGLARLASRASAGRLFSAAHVQTRSEITTSEAIAGGSKMKKRLPPLRMITIISIAAMSTLVQPAVLAEPSGDEAAAENAYKAYIRAWKTKDIAALQNRFPMTTWP